MSELITRRERIGLHLLSGVSALALLASLPTHEAIAREDADRPTVWIELGGQLERIDGTDSAFTAPFMFQDSVPATFQPVSPLEAQKAPRFSFGAEGKTTFAPAGGDWMFSVSVRYGRSNANKNLRQQTYAPNKSKYARYTSGTVVRTLHAPIAHDAIHEFTTVDGRRDESHLILDFQAGRDVGLGLFARGNSTVSFGVRTAQFVARNATRIKSRPNVDVKNALPGTALYLPSYAFNIYELDGSSNRSFRGIGPSISWDASVPVVGDADRGYLAFDWDVNAALLFGKQKAQVHHHTSAMHGLAGLGYGTTTLYNPPTAFRTQSRRVTVPNVGGFAGVSMKFPNAKVSLGYRADFFFGAMDTGIDTHKSSDVGFHGPFAKISVGLGG